MPTIEETARLVVETIGIQGLSELREKLKGAQTQAIELADAFGRGDVKEREFNEQAKILAKSQSDLAKGIAEVERAFTITEKAAEKEAAAVARAAEKEVAAIQRADQMIVEAAARSEKARTAAATRAERDANRVAAAELKVAEAEAARAAKLEASVEPTEKARSKMAGLGQSALQTGRFLQDFAQGGIGGVLNNIEGLSMAIGGGAGLAGVLTGLGLAVFFLQPKIGELFKAMDVGRITTFSDRIEDLKGRIDELEKKPHKIGIDVLELKNAREEVERIKENLEAVERLRREQTKAEQESGQAVAEALAEAGGADVERGIRAQLTREAEATSIPLKEANARIPELNAEIKRVQDLMAHMTDPEQIAAMEQQATILELERAKFQGQLSKAQTDIETAVSDTFGGIINASVKGAGAAQQLAQAELRKRLGETGFGEAATQLEFATPQFVVEAEREKGRGERAIENQTRLAKLEEDQRKRTEQELEEMGNARDRIEKDLAGQAEQAGKATAAAEKRRIATLARRVGGGTLGEEAQDYAARLQERQPGITDADLRAAVQAAVAQEVARRAPQLAPAEQAGVAGAVTEQAMAAPPEDVAARQARQARAAPREARTAQVQGAQQEIQAMSGGQFSDEQSLAAARQAVAYMARGAPRGQAMAAAMREVFLNFQAMAQRMEAEEQQVWALANGMAGMRPRLQSAQRRGR